MFTKGPWYIDTETTCFDVPVGPCGSDLPVLHVEDWNLMDADKQLEAQSNMCLAAAAPKLYEWTKGYYTYLHFSGMAKSPLAEEVGKVIDAIAQGNVSAFAYSEEE